ncbi:hypothetical protein [Crossiella sp. CA198]|uniref:hypothetical protein n=1 Tax=Crossiella sp. CA198 TaxID=3455607 RepID=UPI003F8D27C8
MNLAELIERQKAASGLSYEDMADRARDRGQRIRGNILWQLTRREIAQHPKPDTIRALAAALDTTVREVLDAVEESLGLRRVDVEVADPNIEAWITLTGDRTPEEVAELAEILRQKVDERMAERAAAAKTQPANER